MFRLKPNQYEFCSPAKDFWITVGCVVYVATMVGIVFLIAD